MSSQVKHLYKFDRFLLDTGERVLLRDGELVPLTPKAFETLVAFVENNGRIMEKDDLLKRIWPDTFVEEATLAQNVFTLRKALQQTPNKTPEAGERRYIETIPRRGYRFMADVREVADEEQAISSESASVESPAAIEGESNVAHARDGSEYSVEHHQPVAQRNGDGVRVNGNGGATAEDVRRPAGLAASAGGERMGSVERRNPKLGAALIAAAVVVAAIVVPLALYKFSVRRETTAKPAPSSFESMKVTRLAINGKVEEAVISPDGKYVAYLLNDSGRRSIWARQVASNSNAQQVVPASEYGYGGIVFSHDGEHIFYVAWKIDDQPATLYQVPVYGGPPKKILARINSYISLSADGKQLAFVRVDDQQPKPETSIIIADADGSRERVVVRRQTPERLGVPAWSPDGSALVFPLKTLEPTPGSATLIEVKLADGKERQIASQRWYDVGQLMWLRDGSGLVMNAAEQELSPAQLWLLAYPSGEVRRITNDLNSYAGASITGDGDALVTLQTDLISNIWVAPNGEANRALQITQGTGKYDGYYGLSWTPDGRIVYASIASGAWDIWVMNADGSNQKQLTVDARSNYGPSVSPDGRYIVFISNRTGGAFNVWRMEIDGGNPKQLTDGKGENFVHVSPDGQWVVYATVGYGQPNHVWKVSIDGGEPVRLTDKSASWPFISPDGKQFACTYQVEPRKPYKLAVIPFEGGAPVKTFDLPPTCTMGVVWLQDGRGLAYTDNRGGINNVWLQPVDGGAARPLTDFKSEGVGAYDWSRNGKQLACSRGVETSGVVLIKNFR